MYRGKHCIKSNKRAGKSVVLLASVLLLLCISVGGVVAYLIDATDSVTNIFSPARVTTAVVEDITKDPQVKQDVKIQNTGNTDAWIRAAVVVTWQDSSGNVYGTAPVAVEDYTIKLEPDTGWVQHTDGYYYFNSPVAPNEPTDILIKSCAPVAGRAPNGYNLAVEIIGSGIQSSPASAVQEAWGVTISDGSVTKYTGGGA